MSRQSFLYFAYGSNMLLQRVRRGNPTAVFRAVAVLEDYKLVFRSFSDHCVTPWSGGAATIEPSAGSHVWGIVWELDHKDLSSLDKQEYVYDAIDVDIGTKESEVIRCRTYVLREFEPDPSWDDRPSPQYKDILVRGATQNGIPQEYVEFLQNLDDNGFTGSIQLYQDIIAELENQIVDET